MKRRKKKAHWSINAHIVPLSDELIRLTDMDFPDVQFKRPKWVSKDEWEGLGVNAQYDLDDNTIYSKREGSIYTAHEWIHWWYNHLNKKQRNFLTKMFRQIYKDSKKQKLDIPYAEMQKNGDYEEFIAYQFMDDPDELLHALQGVIVLDNNLNAYETLKKLRGDK